MKQGRRLLPVSNAKYNNTGDTTILVGRLSEILPKHNNFILSHHHCKTLKNFTESVTPTIWPPSFENSNSYFFDYIDLVLRNCGITK